MATFIRKANQSENTQVNFNASKEVAYWAKKYNMSVDAFQKLFTQAGYSISKMFSLGLIKAS